MGLFSRPFTYCNSKGTKYVLHHKTITLKNCDKKVTIYFFAKTARAVGVMRELPQGFKVVENRQSGLPVLARA